MSALGDIVHALPVLAAIKRTWPAAEVDWLADQRYAGVLEFVDGIARTVIGRPDLLAAVKALRARKYDAVLDLQGLLKSAVMARLSGARRVIGFSRPALREPAAAYFYSETVSPSFAQHVIRKNLTLLSQLEIADVHTVTFPLKVPSSAIVDRVLDEVRSPLTRGFALINPGAAWPNKQWPPERFGLVARHLRDEHGLTPYVLWGPQETGLAERVVAASEGLARKLPQTSLGDLLALSARASLMISGDTGPLHIAAALGTPLVGLYGPTHPERNGPWHADDVVLSRADRCECHHKRRCQRAGVVSGTALRCLDEIPASEVTAAVDRRLQRSFPANGHG